MNQPNFYEMIGFASGQSEPHHGAPETPDLDRAVFFLDFDGTLVEIADRPGDVKVDAETRDLLNELHDRTEGATVIVSGRRIEDLDTFLPDFPGIIIGSHGAERRENGKLWQHAARDSKELNDLRRMIEVWAESEPGVLVEEKPCSVVLHFRQAPHRMADADNFLRSVADHTQGFVLHHAKMALEVHPDDVSKRNAIEPLMDRWSSRRPIAFGDDATDEGMFDAVNRRGGHSIKVGGRDTCANFRLDDPKAVRATLRSWLDTQLAGTE